MITTKPLPKTERLKQQHFKNIHSNAKKHRYVIKEESSYHSEFDQWFLTGNWIVYEKKIPLVYKKLFSFKYINCEITIDKYEKKDSTAVKKAASELFGNIEELDCVILELYCN